jgi:hypothetical protein
MPSDGADSGVCRPDAGKTVSMNRKPVDAMPFAATDPAAFGARLAAAARAQTEDLVIYSAKYQRIPGRLGDLPTFFGACSDLVIRAYRTLGVDLQALVQATGVGSGDANIDHRRTATLRRFLAKAGAALPVSQFPEAYKPGDIVTYYRPFSRVSRDHIAIVSDIIAPTGRPMIIHNRGWGPQIEDALFVDRITGHYRYAGQPPEPLVASKPALPLTVTATPATPATAGSAVAAPSAKITAATPTAIRKPATAGTPQRQGILKPAAATVRPPAAVLRPAQPTTTPVPTPAQRKTAAVPPKIK